MGSRSAGRRLCWRSFLPATLAGVVPPIPCNCMQQAYYCLYDAFMWPLGHLPGAGIMQIADRQYI